MTTQVDSISSIAQTGRTSPLRALLWKEWRQQRWVFLGLLGLLVVSIPALLPRFKDSVIVVAGLEMCLIAVVVGANAFCAEKDDQSLQFLTSVPVKPGKLFWIKAGLVLAMVGAAILVTFGVLCLAQRVMEKAPEIPQFFSFEFLFMVFAFSSVALLPAIVSVLAGRTISCVLATGATVIAIVIGIEALAYGLGDEPFVPINFFAFTLPVVVLLGRWLWCWNRIVRSLRARLLRLLILPAVIPIAICAQLISSYTYVTLFAPPEYFLGKDFQAAPKYTRSISPDGRWIVYGCGYDVWMHGGRAAIVNVETRESRWLSRLHASVTWRWSPSSRFLLVSKGTEWLLPEIPLFKSRGYIGGDPPDGDSTFIVNVETGEQRSLASLHPALALVADSRIWKLGWVDGNTRFLFDDKYEYGYFVNAAEWTVSACRQKYDLKNAHVRASSTPRGVFVIFDAYRTGESQIDGTYKAILARLAPNLEQAETLPLQLPYPIAYLRHTSDDGQWGIVVNVSMQKKEAYQYLCSLGTGKTTFLNIISTEEKKQPGPIESNALILGFVPGSHKLLVSDANVLSQFDVDKLETVGPRIPLPLPEDNVVSRASLSPSGRFALAYSSWASDNVPGYIMADLQTGRTWTFDEGSGKVWKWISDEQLVSNEGEIINYDGSGKRLLLGEQ